MRQSITEWHWRLSGKHLKEVGMGDADELLDIEQAAHFLNVSETSLRRWTNAGRLACLRVGRRRERRFRRTDLLAFMEEQPATGLPSSLRSSSPHLAHTLVDGVSYPLGTHLCGLFASESGRIKQVLGFLEDGLRPGTVCFYSAPKGARAGILSHLEKSRPSLRRDIASGLLVLSDLAASPRGQLQYWEASMRAALRSGAHTCRAVVDLRGLGSRLSDDGIFEYEAGYEEAIARRFPLVTLCQYDVREVPSLTLFHALKLHRDTFRYPAERVLG